VEEPPVRLVQRNASGEVNYGDLDRPAITRKRSLPERGARAGESDLDYLDVPAFLRRQAD